MKPLYRGLAVAVAAVGIAACVKQAWRVTYEGPGDYSSAHALTLADNGTTFMAGFVDQQQLFIAAYNANGELLWDRLLQAEAAGNNLSVGKSLALGPDGNVYLAALSYPDLSTLLFKLNSETGEVLLSRALESSDFFRGMQIDSDGTLYLDGYAKAAAYTGNGDLLWAYPVTDEAAAESVLSELNSLHVSQASSAGDVAYMGYRRSLVLVDGRTFVMIDGQIVELDDHGNIVQQVSLEALGLTSGEAIHAFSDRLLLVGSSGVTSIAVAVGLDLSLIQSSELSTDNLSHISVSGSEHYLCVASMGYGVGPVNLQQLNADGSVRWSVALAGQPLHQELAYTLSSGDDCYFSAPFASQTSVETRTSRFGVDGKLADTISLPHYSGPVLAVQNKSIFHAGIMQTGSVQYIDAVLIKHQRY